MSEMLHTPPEFDEAMVDAPVDYEALAAQLKSDVEGLAERVMYSRSALTARCTPHVAIRNGIIVREGESVGASFASPEQVVAQTLSAILALRNQHRGPVDLIWRVEPTFEPAEDGVVRLYVRLCFEPSLTQVATGVWVEKRMAELTPFGTWANV